VTSPAKDRDKKKDGGTGAVDVAAGGPGGESVSYDAQRRIQDALDGSVPALPYAAAVVDRVEAGWDVLTRPDGLRVRLDPRPGATAALRVTAGTLVTGLDLSAAALASAEVLALRERAKAFLDSAGGEVVAVLVKAVLSYLVKRVNETRVTPSAPFPALLAADVKAGVRAEIVAGAGD
jgi:hypothetical protein